jgi:hypothetical protein
VLAIFLPERAGFRRRDGAVDETLKWEQRGGNLFLRLIDAAPLQDSLLSEHWLVKVIIKCRKWQQLGREPQEAKGNRK